VTIDLALALVQSGLKLGLLVAAPLLLAQLVVGVVVGLLQAVTQIQEQTIAFIAKLAAVAVVLTLAGPWMLGQVVEFARALIAGIPGRLG
jgi:flagellar biosynthetic protein FliQ